MEGSLVRGPMGPTGLLPIFLSRPLIVNELWRQDDRIKTTTKLPNYFDYQLSISV